MIVGFGVRFQWAMERHGDEPFKWLNEDEYHYYVSTAINALNGQGLIPEYNKAEKEIYVPPPLQPLFVLGIFKLAGGLVHPLYLQLAQICLSLLMIFLCGEIGKRLSNHLGGILFAFLVAIYPYFVHWSAFIMTESNYLVGLSLVVFLLLRWIDKPILFRAALAAAFLGLLNLQRVNGFYLGL